MKTIFGAFGELDALLGILLDGVDGFRLSEGGDACRERDCGEPVAAGVSDVGGGVLELLFAADGGHIVAVGDGFAEAGEVRLDAAQEEGPN